MIKIPKLKKLTIDGTTVDIGGILKKEYEDIGQASAEIPTIIEWINQVQAEYTESSIIARHTIKEVEAHVYFEAKDGTLLEEYTGKVTEKVLEHAIAKDERVIEAHAEYAHYRSWENRLRNLMSSLQAKLDLCRSTEATRRQVFSETEND